MPTKTKDAPKCQVCTEAASKYRCSACPVRYCSVTCYKTHKAQSCCSRDRVGPSAGPSAAPLLDFSEEAPLVAEQVSGSAAAAESNGAGALGSSSDSLRPLTSLLWPPEPDPSVFTDPLRKEDPKPLRRDELLRIATSPQLRHLLSTTTISNILRIIDSLPSPAARASALSRCLGIDDVSLSRPGGGTFLSQRDSPPPFDALLSALAGEGVDDRGGGMGGGGWWLGREEGKEGRIWIGDEEKRIMRLWAGVVCQAIEGGKSDDVGWGSGGLAWEV